MGIKLIKKSTIKTLLATSVVFLLIIALIIFVDNKKIKDLEKENGRQVLRVVATDTIMPGVEITGENVKCIQEKDVVDAEGLIYRMTKNAGHNEEGKKIIDDKGNYLIDKEDAMELVNDNRYAIGKIATQKISKGEWITTDKLATPEEFYKAGQRLYAIPFDADTTGGFNVSKGEYVDIVVRYKTDVKLEDPKLNPTIRAIYSSLQPNQITDIVFSKRLIEDIRDETGASVIENSATKPGYICFRLTYDEINKLNWAQECGTIYIGKSIDYAQDPYVETFMQGIELPNIGGVSEEITTEE